MKRVIKVRKNEEGREIGRKKEKETNEYSFEVRNDAAVPSRFAFHFSAQRTGNF